MDPLLALYFIWLSSVCAIVLYSITHTLTCSICHSELPSRHRYFVEQINEGFSLGYPCCLKKECEKIIKQRYPSAICEVQKYF